MKRQYLNSLTEKEWEKKLNLDNHFPLAIDGFMHHVSYHYTGHVRKELFEKVRTLFYDLSVEDHLRMAFLKGVTLALCNLFMQTHSHREFDEKKASLLDALWKIFSLPQLSFIEFATDHSHFFSRPCADDILDTRLVRGFIDYCLPAIEEMHFGFGFDHDFTKTA